MRARRGVWTRPPRPALALAVAWVAILGAGCDEDRRPPRTWTVAVYMAADNGLSAASGLDLEELRSAASSPYVTVLVEQDVVGRTARRYRIAGGALEELADLGEVDTSDPATLTDFVAWAATTARSDRTVLVLWSDGKGWDELDGPRAVATTTVATVAGAVATDPATGGPAVSVAAAASTSISIRSMFPDQDNGGLKAPFMKNADLRRAVEAAGVHVDVLGLDACLMGALEALYELRGLADYLVASEELEPTRGWDYTGLLSALAADPGMTPEELARVAVERYRAWYEDVFFPSVPFERYPTLAAFRAEGLDAVAAAVDARAAALREALADPARRADTVATLSTGRAAVQAIDQLVKPHVYVDLVDLEVRLGGDTAIADALSRATVAEYHGAARPGAHGVSIVFFDRPLADQWGTYDPNYRNYDRSTGAGNASEFITRFQWDELLAEFYAARGL
jgi:hypothetical protein